MWIQEKVDTTQQHNGEESQDDDCPLGLEVSQSALEQGVTKFWKNIYKKKIPTVERRGCVVLAIE